MITVKKAVVLQKIAQSGLSLRAWAIQNGFTQQSVYAWTSGINNITPKNLERLSSALHCDPSEISEIVLPVCSERIVCLERDREEIVGLFGQLTAPQRSRILRLAQSLVDANRTECEIERVRDFGEDAQ